MGLLFCYLPLMTTVEIVGLTITLLVMLIGLAGSLVPVLPGPPLVLIAALGHRLWFGQHSASRLVLIILAVMTLAALALDYFASVYGAKRYGATWRGLLGAFVGGLVGLFFSIPGIILGPFVGALLFELMGGYEFDKASRAGLGATLGVFVGVVVKCILSVVMIGLFTVSAVLRSRQPPRLRNYVAIAAVVSFAEVPTPQFPKFPMESAITTGNIR